MDSFNDINSVIGILTQRTVYNTPSILSSGQVLSSEELNFSTLDEDALLRQKVAQYQQKARRRGWLIKAGVGLVGALIGTVANKDFDLSDGINGSETLTLLGGASAGFAAGGIGTQLLQDLDEKQLEELGIKWTSTPDSYLFHQKSHNGNASRRLILISTNPESGQPGVSFAVQFPDGYISKLNFVRKELYGITEKFSVDASFSVSKHGLHKNWFQRNSHFLGELSTDNGLSLPVELWKHNNDSGKSVVAIPYSKPHQFVY